MKMLTIAGALIAATATAAAQTVYQCDDENERKVFSQTPCAPSAEAIEVQVPKLTPEKKSAREEKGPRSNCLLTQQKKPTLVS